MNTRSTTAAWLLGLANYGMLPVLLLLCLLFSVQTYSEQYREGADAGQLLAAEIIRQKGPQPRVVAFVQGHESDKQLLEALQSAIESSGGSVVAEAQGEPSAARQALEEAAKQGKPIDALACTRITSQWSLVKNVSAHWPVLGQPEVITPPTFWWPNFLMPDNIRNIANSISVTAIIAIGMTMVIITGGIDLSVGSLIALSAVIATLLIRDGIHVSLFGFEAQWLGGGVGATTTSMIFGSLIAILACGLVGLASGGLVTAFRMPAFIVTLSGMLIARGLAQTLTNSESVYQIPPAYTWLGGQASLWNIPNAVMLMIILYAVAYVVMHHTVLGRYLYAVGGNMEAARLSGVPIVAVLLFAYTICGMLAGVGGIVMASRQKSGSATYGVMYELYVIAAVVVGGTSIFGGEGKILGTLIGAFMIAVIETGMNLTHVRAEIQPVVLGFVILGAVLLDQLKQWLIRRTTVVAP